MSNQFSYELDERQIRLMLQDGELEYDSSAWNRFEQVAKPEFKSQSPSLVSKLNLSISRSVIVPGIFILLIGGLSAMLFSFVDFKKKDQAVTKPVSESANKPLPVKTVITKQTVMPAKKEAATTPTVQEQEHKTVVITTPLNTTTAIIKKEETQSVAKPETKPVTINPPVKANALSVATEKKKEVMPVPFIKRKRKKETSEEIPTINTSSTLLNSTVTQEPELELK